jgi:anti-anti-sigma regulatory factor
MRRCSGSPAACRRINQQGPSGLHTLIAAHKRAEAEGRELLLVIPSPTVLRVFVLTGMDKVIPNVTSLPEALARTAATANGHSRRTQSSSPA